MRIIIVFAVALITRLLYLFLNNTDPTLLSPLIDAKSYLALASEYLKYGTVSSDFFWQSPFYPAFITFFGWIQGSESADTIIMSLRVIQSIVGSFTALIVFLIGRKIRNEKTGLIAGLIFALYGPSVFYDLDLGPAVWAAFFASLLLYLFVIEQKGKILPIVIGLISAFALFTRSELFPFAFASLIWICWKIKKSDGIKPAAMHGTLALAGFMIVAIPALVVRYDATARVSLLPQSGGINFYIGNNPDNESINIRPGYEWTKLHRKLVQAGYDNVDKRASYFFNQGIQYLLNDPKGFILNTFSKTAQLFSSREIPRNEDVYIMREFSPVLKGLVWKIGLFGFPFGILLPFAVFGFIRCRKELPPFIYMQLIFVGGSLIMIFISARYRIPLIPIFAIAAAVGISTAFDFKKSIVSICAAAGFFAVSLIGPFPAEKFNFKAEMYKILGQTSLENKDIEKGKTYLNKALECKPDYEEVYFIYGLHYKARYDFDNAVDCFKKAGSIEEAKMEIYYLLNLMNKKDESIKYLSENIESLSDFPQMNLEYGYHLSTSGNDSAAVKYLEKVIEQKYNRVEGFILLGDAYKKLNRTEEAENIYKKGLSLFPNNGILRERISIKK